MVLQRLLLQIPGLWKNDLLSDHLWAVSSRYWWSSKLRRHCCWDWSWTVVCSIGPASRSGRTALLMLDNRTSGATASRIGCFGISPELRCLFNCQKYTQSHEAVKARYRKNTQIPKWETALQGGRFSIMQMYWLLHITRPWLIEMKSTTNVGDLLGQD